MTPDEWDREALRNEYADLLKQRDYLLGLVERLEAVAAAGGALDLCATHPRGELDCKGCLAEWTSRMDVACELERLDAYRAEHGE